LLFIKCSMDLLSSTAPECPQADRTARNVTAFGKTVGAEFSMSLNKSKASSPCPWRPYESIILDQKTTFLLAIRSNTFRATVVLPHFAYMLISALHMMMSESSPQRRTLQCTCIPYAVFAVAEQALRADVSEILLRSSVHLSMKKASPNRAFSTQPERTALCSAASLGHSVPIASSTRPQPM
jgi:hypothetical protein